MEHPRLKLLADQNRAASVDPDRVQAFAEERMTLFDALKLDAEDAASLRRQAQALFEVRRPRDSIAVLRGLFALGKVHLEDVVLMMLCFEALGDDESAQMWSVEVDRLATVMEEVIVTEERSQS